MTTIQAIPLNRALGYAFILCGISHRSDVKSAALEATRTATALREVKVQSFAVIAICPSVRRCRGGEADRGILRVSHASGRRLSPPGLADAHAPSTGHVVIITTFAAMQIVPAQPCRCDASSAETRHCTFQGPFVLPGHRCWHLAVQLALSSSAAQRCNCYYSEHACRCSNWSSLASWLVLCSPQRCLSSRSAHV